MRNLVKIAALSGVALALAEGDSKGGAKAPAAAPAERQPITARGADLLALVAAAGDAGLMLTQEEGLEAVTAGFLAVDTSVTEGNTAKVTLTDAGRASLTSSGNSATNYEIDDAVPMPASTVRRGRQGGYPFDNLNVGQSFHVAPNPAKPASGDKPAVPAETPADVAARLQSSVSGARARFAEEIPGETESYTVRTYKKTEDGKAFLKDAEGKRIVDTETPGTRPKTKLTRDFKVMPVDASDPKGPGARVWRIAIPGAAA